MSRDEQREMLTCHRGSWELGGQLTPGVALSPEEGRLFGCFYRLLQAVLLQRDETFLGEGGVPLCGTRRARVFYGNSPLDTTPARVHTHTCSPQEFLKEKKILQVVNCYFSTFK